jgi:1,4-dihydroxy-2-naphthoate octaprenyltransferase
VGKERYIVYVLAIWRLSNMLVDELGPFHVFAKLRHKVGVKYSTHNNPYGETFLSEIFSCVYCVSVWISIIFVICDKLHKVLLSRFAIPMALSTGAILMGSLINRGTQQ